ncbi:PAP2 superfamily-domain-containing protein [Microdochium trichocladiopsis]|uniref:PAP2 superfamily-domain-containing protein n=1 Tax=Microdochium trichocladiopsis TaxID=1682393 RepID=A0A9P9BN34_9PEZI|nr:PAP2 superfamily-domain-containing protein [Microdochium trichocladiopsis]KAH7026546.1 PAP2 superfamily-domain-containing protein [Microdochium trichocladiopsis]
MKSASSTRPASRSSNKITVIQILSYVFDWIILVAVGVVGLILGDVTPNKRPFSLQDPNISFPFTQKETVNSFWLMMCNSVFPVIIILIVALIFVPGSTVPEGTPKKLVWKRKLWELHTGWLGLALSLICAWIITQGMKNLFGKPRPDLLVRCQADIANWADHLAGYNNPPTDGYHGQLVKATICTNSDKHILDDGFRSYPSGHSSSAAAGLIYLSLFLASKFALTIPFVLPEAAASNATSASATAFPSRMRGASRANTASSSAAGVAQAGDEFSYPDDPNMAQQLETHHTQITAVRRQAAAPPLYLLVVAVLPFFTAIFIASSRWFDFRHHGFDILFGFIIGTITAWFAFRYYHLPLRSGAGWAWGPRSHDKAFWAGVGSYTYATNKKDWDTPGDEEERMMSAQRGNNIELTNRSRSKLSSTENTDTSYSPHAM